MAQSGVRYRTGGGSRYRLTLIVSTDGSAYSTSLREIRNTGCGSSFFSDQTGQIYEGTALDCPKTVG